MTSAATIRPRVPEDDPQIVALYARVNPEFPAMSVEELRHRIATIPPDVRWERLVAEIDGRVVGASTLMGMFWSKQPGGYWSHVAVDPDRRGRGIGSSLYDRLLARAREFAADRLYAWFKENHPEGERFASRRGFERTGRVERESRLDVHAANLDGYEGIEERLAAEGIRIATLAEAGPDDESLLHAVYRLDQETVADIPMAEPFAGVSYEQWYGDAVEAPGLSPEAFWIALDGERPVGLAILKRLGERAAYNEYTAVDRAYRGRGIARALKLQTIAWARQNGIDAIYTGNDIDNKRMLAVNIRLGYRPLPSEIQVLKRL